MLQEHLSTLTSDLGLKEPLKLNEKKSCAFTIAEVDIKISQADAGVFFKANIAQTPQKKREEIFTKLMQANLLGQGTAGSVIGIDKQEKFLTLSLIIPYEMNYEAFKETLEDFVNYLIYWRDEIDKIIKEELF